MDVKGQIYEFDTLYGFIHHYNSDVSFTCNNVTTLTNIRNMYHIQISFEVKMIMVRITIKKDQKYHYYEKR